MASALEDPYKAAETTEKTEKKIINELPEWIEVNRWNRSDHSDKDIKVFIREELDALNPVNLSAGIHASSCCSQTDTKITTMSTVIFTF
jgi:hypothetical protein